MSWIYQVTATCPSAEVQAEFIHWLDDEGHIKAVIAGGADSGEILQVQEGDSYKVIVCYRFASVEVFKEYVAGPATELREEGRTRFAEGRGVTFERAVFNSLKIIE